MKRTLSLTRETLSPLTGDELAAVAGAGHTFPECQVEMTLLIVRMLTEPVPVTRPCAR